MNEQYNSAHTGPEIDAAVEAVKQKESAWDGKADEPSVVQITLSASGWLQATDPTKGFLQPKTVTGVLADETKQLIQPVPAVVSQTAYYDAGILCTGQAADSLAFTAKTAPTEDLTVYVVITEVQL